VDADTWIRRFVEPSGELERVSEAPWSRVSRVPVGDDAAWLKECSAGQAFEIPLTVALARRWPDRLPAVLGHDVERRRLLQADAGRPLRVFGRDALEAWLLVLPLYAELQLGEVRRVEEHLAAGVQDQRPGRLPPAYEELLETDLGLGEDELSRLRRFLPRLGELCEELAASGPPSTVQHDDLHDANVFERDGRFAILDWGDTSIGHPFATMHVTFRVIAEVHALEPGDRWFARLRDAYLEPWNGSVETFVLAQQVASLSRTLTWRRIVDDAPAAERRQPFEALSRNLRACLDTLAAPFP
jgi:Phosphotransferase enzyme family